MNITKAQRITLLQRKSCCPCGPRSVGCAQELPGLRQGSFSRISDEGRLLSRSEVVKSSKDEFPADGDSICHGRKIFCRPGASRASERCCQRATKHFLSTLCLHPLGRGPSDGRCFPLPLFFCVVLAFLARPALGDAAACFHLLSQHFMEHQRHFT